MNKKSYPIIAGIISVLLMGTVPAMRRQLAENLSTYTSGAVNCILSGTTLLIINLRKNGIAPVKEIDRRYWLCCAIPFFIYNFTSYMATGLAATREGSILAGLFTQLWPLGGLALTVIILNQKTKIGFWPSCILSVIGVFFSTLAGSSLSIKETLSSNVIAIISGMIDPVFYGIYSGYYCKLVKDSKYDYHPILEIILGMIMMVFAFIYHETVTTIDCKTVLIILFQVLFSGIIASELWKYALRSNQRMIALLLSNITPVISTVFSALFLKVNIRWPVMAGSIIIVISVVLAKKNIVDNLD